MKRKEQIDQLKAMSVEELREQADSLKESLFRLKFRKALAMGNDISAQVKAEKKTLARVYTMIQEKEAQAAAK